MVFGGCNFLGLLSLQKMEDRHCLVVELVAIGGANLNSVLG